jgi:hypothetical protein
MYLASLVLEENKPGARVRKFSTLYSGTTTAVKSLDAGEVYDRLELDMQLYVASQAPKRVFIHAGVVGWKGKAILIPGRSFTGKSTLVRALIEAGATYYSDEYAVLDHKGRVHPYPCPLKIRDETGRARLQWSVDQLGATIGRKPIPVGMVVSGEYKANARWRPRRLSPGRGALELFNHAVSARQEPARDLAAIRQVVSHAPVFRGSRGEAKEIAKQILDKLTI